jgi:hypothetical protein
VIVPTTTATLDELIEAITCATNAGKSNKTLIISDVVKRSVFLFTFPTFTTPRELLDKLIERYIIGIKIYFNFDYRHNLECTDILSQEGIDNWRQQTQKPIRLRIFNFIKVNNMRNNNSSSFGILKFL